MFVCLFLCRVLMGNELQILLLVSVSSNFGVVFVASQSCLFCVLYTYGSQGTYSLNLLSYEDGPGDKVEHILEIKSFGLAMLYKVKN